MEHGGFFQGLPIWNAMRTELGLTHCRVLSCVQNGEARTWCVEEAAQVSEAGAP